MKHRVVKRDLSLYREAHRDGQTNLTEFGDSLEKANRKDILKELSSRTDGIYEYLRLLLSSEDGFTDQEAAIALKRKVSSVCGFNGRGGLKNKYPGVCGFVYSDSKRMGDSKRPISVWKADKELFLEYRKTVAPDYRLPATIEGVNA